ncbi:MAG: stimulus-sensing domain-containing protein, partial [Alphaproteobacteria bacterium]|nr:stimulus-sensing domain-containing protein [Alphaproteobacteria bacterium]
TISGQAGNFQLNAMLPVIAYNVLQSLQLLSEASRVFADKAISSFTVNQQHIQQQLTRNPILVTALNPVIGYELGAKIAKTAYQQRRSLLEVAQEMTDMTKADLERLLDPEKLPESAISRVPFRDDGFAALQLSIKPERVTRILRRLIEPAKLRARIYSRDGTLIVDSSTLLTRGQLSREAPRVSDRRETPNTKDFWTRFRAWMIDKELPVYREIGNANGKAYKEVGFALRGQTTSMLLLNDRRQQIVSVAVPIRQMNSVQGVLLLSSRAGEIDKILWDETKVLWTPFLMAVVATVLASWLLARTVAGPMRRLSDAAERVSLSLGGKEEIPDFPGRVDEVGQMADAFQAMTAALYKRIAASEKFAADVAHELKNPLAAARSTADSLEFAKDDTQRQELVHQIQNELKRLNRLITDVSNTSRLDAELARQKMAVIDLTEVADGVARIFKDVLADDTRRVRLVIAPARVFNAYLVRGDDGRLAQVFTNLIDNALSFSPEKGTVTLRLSRDKGDVVVVVDDEGPGIADENYHTIFDRFYSDRPDTDSVRGKNSGLGLSISRDIVRSHQGTVSAQNRINSSTKKVEGARFTVRLPAISNQTRGSTTSGRRA